LVTKVVTNHFPRLLPKLISLKRNDNLTSLGLTAAESTATYSPKNLWGEPRPGVLAMLTEPLQKLYREMLAMPESPFKAFRLADNAKVTDEMIASLVEFYDKARKVTHPAGQADQNNNPRKEE
jgi:hypothetical protein